jgi:hypothetical protein
VIIAVVIAVVLIVWAVRRSDREEEPIENAPISN